MRTGIGLGFAVLLVTTAACTASTFSGGDAGNDDAGVTPVNGGSPPPGCDTSKLPADDACVVNDAEGVFASSSLGSASGNGTKESPYASLDAALAAAKKVNKRVYACAESFAEQIHFQDGVDVFGYFDCKAGWNVTPGAHAKVVAPASPAATAANIVTATRVEAVDILSPEFTTGSQSSIALVATGSPALKITHATIHAGTGGKGADGANAVALTDSGAAKNGAAAEAEHVCVGTLCASNLGSIGGANACSGVAGHAPANGGSGGSGGQFLAQNDGFTFHWYAVTQYPTSAGNPTVWSQQSALGGTIDQAGAPGDPGAAGKDGAAGAAFGTVTKGVYTPADGTAGLDGQPGQSGGGSGGHALLYGGDPDFNPGTYATKYAWGEGGAGGGAGGCPGLAGDIGKGGGASIGILAVASPLTLDTVVVTTSAGGAGGASGLPSVPSPGGVGGAAGKYAKAGGNGGNGGEAGVSGNGAGGPSVGIAYQGTQPQTLGSTITPGSGGAGVAQRVLIWGTIVPASPNGVSAQTYGF